LGTCSLPLNEICMLICRKGTQPSTPECDVCVDSETGFAAVVVRSFVLPFLRDRTLVYAHVWGLHNPKFQNLIRYDPKTIWPDPFLARLRRVVPPKPECDHITRPNLNLSIVHDRHVRGDV